MVGGIPPLKTPQKVINRDNNVLTGSIIWLCNYGKRNPHQTPKCRFNTTIINGIVSILAIINRWYGVCISSDRLPI